MTDLEERRRFLRRMLRERLHKVVDDPKVRRLLTAKEAESGLDTVIERIVENVLEKEKRLKRKLNFAEFRETVMETLNEFAPPTKYIV